MGTWSLGYTTAIEYPVHHAGRQSTIADSVSMPTPLNAMPSLHIDSMQVHATSLSSIRSWCLNVATIRSSATRAGPTTRKTDSVQGTDACSIVYHLIEEHEPPVAHGTRHHKP